MVQSKHKPTGKGGRSSGSERPQLISLAIRHIQELEYLEESPLARLPAVHDLAYGMLKDAVIPLGLALQQFLLDSVSVVIRDFGKQAGYHRVIQFLRALVDGQPVTEISRELGLSREHVARTVQPQAVALVGRVFLVKAGHEAVHGGAADLGDNNRVRLLVPAGYKKSMIEDEADFT